MLVQTIKENEIYFTSIFFKIAFSSFAQESMPLGKSVADVKLLAKTQDFKFIHCKEEPDNKYSLAYESDNVNGETHTFIYLINSQDLCEKIFYVKPKSALNDVKNLLIENCIYKGKNQNDHQVWHSKNGKAGFILQENHPNGNIILTEVLIE